MKLNYFNMLLNISSSAKSQVILQKAHGEDNYNDEPHIWDENGDVFSRFFKDIISKTRH